MSPRARNIIVGTFVLASLLLLLFGVYFLKETVPGRKTTRTMRASIRSTLEEGDPVKVNGVSMGKVTGVELEGTGVRVTFNVQHGLLLPKDSEIRIQNIGLMGSGSSASA